MLGRMAREPENVRGGTVELLDSGTTLRRAVSSVSSVSELAQTIAIRASDSAPVAVDPSPTSFGSNRDRYEDRRSLGEGGMGEVILCKDKWIGREVARKVAHVKSGSRPGVQQRFLREVRVQGQLEHPGIVPVYDLGLAPDGAAFFTMKRVKGRTLEEVVHGLRAADPEVCAACSRRKLLTAMSQVCLTVAFAHSRGVVHRDLKPANVMLGDFGEVYVLDWGVARVGSNADDPELEEPVETHPVGRTEAGALLGTPGYMAPEQVRGEVEVIDPRSDVYALGAILFELLALQPLHPGRTIESLFASTLAGAASSPAERAPEQEIAPELDEICRRATALDPEQRFQSARQMQEAIESFLDGERDLERRRELADAHATAARRALGEAEAGVAGSDALRALAMRELGASLALDPTNQDALDTMLKLLLQPSNELPPEAEAELWELTRRDRVRAARRAMVALVAWYLFTPMILWMGVLNWPALLALDALLLGMIGYEWWMSRTGNVQPRYMRLAIPLAFLSIAGLGLFFGPFVLVPAVATGACAALMIGLRANQQTRIFIVTCALAAVFVPALLQLAGVLPASYVFEAGSIKLLPFATELPAAASATFVVLATVLTIVSSGVLVGKATASLIDAERRVFGQAYRLRQLLPAAARPISLPPPATETACVFRG
jgi:eukaryotic-like serine/threonine-protein kinase